MIPGPTFIRIRQTIPRTCVATGDKPGNGAYRPDLFKTVPLICFPDIWEGWCCGIRALVGNSFTIVYRYFSRWTSEGGGRCSGTDQNLLPTTPLPSVPCPLVLLNPSTLRKRQTCTKINIGCERNACGRCRRGISPWLWPSSSKYTHRSLQIDTSCDPCSSVATLWYAYPS